MVFDDWKEPSEKVVKHFTEVFDISNYKTETELRRLFAENPTDENIRRRVNRLSAIYGTRISMPDQEAISAYIFDEDIVGNAKAGDPDVVKNLAFNEERGYDRCLSFASKFCSFCNPCAYPIYDSLVLEALLELNRIHSFDSAYDERERNQIKYNYDYERFCQLIEKFRNHEPFGLGNCTLREIDKFLWITGKGLVD